MQLSKIAHTRYTYSVTVGGEKFQPCELLETLWLVRSDDVELWNMSKKKLAALNSAGILKNAVQKGRALGGPNLDKTIDDLTTIVMSDADLILLWQERYAMKYHTGQLAQR